MVLTTGTSDLIERIETVLPHSANTGVILTDEHFGYELQTDRFLRRLGTAMAYLAAKAKMLNKLVKWPMNS